MSSRDVRLYLAGLTASSLGTSAMTLVAGIWVKSLTGSNRAAALVSVCVFVPSLLAPLAGVAADRLGRRALLTRTNLAAAAGLLVLLLVRDAAQAWLVFAVMLGYGVVLVVVDPAETALFSELVPPGERGGLNGLRLTIQEGSKLLAPLLGAGLFAWVGGRSVAAIDALTFVVAAVAVLLLRGPDRAPEPRVDQGWREEVLGGIRHLRRTPPLGRLAVVGALAMGATGLGSAAQFALLDALHRPPAFLGVLVSLLGAGSIAAGLLSGAALRRVDERGLLRIALTSGAVGYVLVATGWLPAVLAGRVVFGFHLPWVVVAVVTAGQRLTPDRLQGRVAAAITMMLFAAQPVTQALGAALLGPLDYRAIYLLIAANAVVLLLVLGAGGSRGSSHLAFSGTYRG